LHGGSGRDFVPWIEAVESHGETHVMTNTNVTSTRRPRVVVELPPELWRQVKEVARQEERSGTAAVRWLLREYVKRGEDRGSR
jgi:hypothetical protein